MFTDQRFFPPPYSPPSPILTQKRSHPILVRDSEGHDVTAKLIEFDHAYPEDLQPTRYQGVVKPHTITLHFGDVRELSHPTLVLGCWIFWTDTSINVAMSQSATRQASPTCVEIWHPQEGWKKLETEFGLPCGKDKWVVLDLRGHYAAHDAGCVFELNHRFIGTRRFWSTAPARSPTRSRDSCRNRLTCTMADSAAFIARQKMDLISTTTRRKSTSRSGWI